MKRKVKRKPLTKQAKRHMSLCVRRHWTPERRAEHGEFIRDRLRMRQRPEARDGP